MLIINKLSALLFLLTFTLWGQQASFRIDWSNALFGSEVNKPALNYKIGFSDYYNGTHTMLGMEIEQFKELNYIQWTFIKIDQELPLNEKFSVLPGIAFSQIYHKTTYSNNALSYAFNLEVQYTLNNFLKLSVQANIQRAADIKQLWRKQAYGGLIYYWE